MQENPEQQTECEEQEQTPLFRDKLASWGRTVVGYRVSLPALLITLLICAAVSLSYYAGTLAGYKAGAAKVTWYAAQSPFTMKDLVVDDFNLVLVGERSQVTLGSILVNDTMNITSPR